MRSPSGSSMARVFANRGRWRLVQTAVFLLVVLPTLAVAFIGCLRVRQELTARAMDRRSVIAELVGRSVQMRFDALVELGRSLATRVAFREHVRDGRWDDAIAILRDVPADFPQVERVFLTDVSGTLKADAPHLPDVVGVNFSGRDWYRGVSREWKPYVSEVYQRAAEPRIHVVAIAVPVRGASDGAVSGILVLQISLDTLLGWTREVAVGGSGEIYLTDREGKLMTHPSYDAMGAIVDFSTVPAIREALSGSTGVGIAYNPIAREERVHATWSSPTYGHVAVVSEPTASVFAARDREMRYLYGIFGLIVLLNMASAAALVRALRALSSMFRKERTFLSSIGDGVVGIDRSWSITLWNPMAAKLTGWSEAEALGKPFRERVRFIRENDRKENLLFIEECMLYGEARPMSNNTLLLARDGREIPVGDSAAPIFDEDGVVTGVIIVFRDVTREKDASLLRTDFAYASHQLRTPVNKALWDLELALEEAAPPQVKERLKVAYRSVLDVHKLSNRLLDVSMIDQRQVVPEYEEADVAALIEGAVEASRRAAEERGIRVQTSAAPKGLVLDTDAKLLRGALRELVENAVLYGRAGMTVEIEARAAKHEIVFQVRDQGLGIPEDQQPLVFTKFFRGQNIPEDAAGSGLGLFIARAYVRLLGGKIWFESKAGKGSVFYVSIPRIRGMKE